MTLIIKVILEDGDFGKMFQKSASAASQSPLRCEAKELFYTHKLNFVFIRV